MTSTENDMTHRSHHRFRTAARTARRAAGLLLLATLPALAQRPAVVDLRPNGGETYDAGSTLDVAWNPSLVRGSVAVEVWNARLGTWTVASAGTAASSGTYRWRIPDGFAGDACRVRVGPADSHSGGLCSEGFFSIADAEPPPHGERANASDPVAMETYPNPFNPSTTFRYTAVDRGMTISVYDPDGRRVAELRDAGNGTGERRCLVFDAAGLPSGTYAYRYRYGRYSGTGTIVLVK
jgi:hypothetical protein